MREFVVVMAECCLLPNQDGAILAYLYGIDARGCGRKADAAILEG